MEKNRIGIYTIFISIAIIAVSCGEETVFTVTPDKLNTNNGSQPQDSEQLVERPRVNEASANTGDDAQSSTGESETILPNLIAEGGLQTACQNANLVKESKIDLSFPATQGLGCEVKGEKIAANMTGYRRQDVEINVPQDAYLCDIELSTENTQFVYDDELLMTLNGFFLAGANHTSQSLLDFGMTKTGNLIAWDWQKHYNTKRDHDIGGCSHASMNCVFPRTETTGIVQLDVPATWFDELPIKQVTEQKFILSVLAIGNQNASTDCSHNGLNFSGQIRFVSTK